MRKALAAGFAFALVVTACSSDEPANTSTTTTTAPTTTSTTEPLPPLAVSSPSLQEGELVPTQFTCDGADINPQLDIVGLPD